MAFFNYNIDMIKPICKDVFFLSKKANKASKSDIQVGIDLLDTLRAHKDECIGMAANMIGYNLAIIVVNMALVDVVMFNPKIISKSGEYKTSEACLSLSGTRNCIRHQKIKVEYYDLSFKKCVNEYSGIIAETIEHEIDHLNGVII